MTCTGSPLSWSGWNCGRALKSGLKNAFGDAFRRQKCFAEKMEAIWTNSFKIRGKSLYKNIRYARIKFKTFHTEFSIILSVVVVRWSRVEPMALVSDPVTYPFFFPSIFFCFCFCFFCFSFLVDTYFNKGCFGNRALVFESGRTSDVVVLHRQPAMPPVLALWQVLFS